MVTTPGATGTLFVAWLPLALEWWSLLAILVLDTNFVCLDYGRDT